MTLIIERLQTAPTVAAAKYFSGAAVDDPAREQVVLDAAADASHTAGGDAAHARAVFSDQIEAHKTVQRSLLNKWRNDSADPPTSAPDLQTEVRPILDALTPEIVDSLKDMQTLRGTTQCLVLLAQRLNSVEASVEVRRVLPAATSHLCV